MLRMVPLKILNPQQWSDVGGLQQQETMTSHNVV
ncbi:unnamed protein product [Wuchereria bancrofti]|uniref:Uncharacterized protein n=1 Tax=Wuchereria bancrofti TaxID=6293 RepID=A0A3P7E361_WUCBA|nr:unnamed protein product [Wuchereria bancrofti]